MDNLLPDPEPSDPLGSRPRPAWARLLRLRQDSGLSVPELARRLGWVVGRVVAIEGGHVVPSDDEEAAWAEACGTASSL